MFDEPTPKAAWNIDRFPLQQAKRSHLDTIEGATEIANAVIAYTALC